jgi:hypothetical protein
LTGVGRHPFPGPGLAIRVPGEIFPLHDGQSGRLEIGLSQLRDHVMMRECN